MASSRNALIMLALLLGGFTVTTTVHGADSPSFLLGNCTDDEYAGIGNCVSAGSGFTFDQKKAERCPQSNDDPVDWNDEKWQCHIYCSNPKRSDERKACTNCDAVDISSDCFDAQSLACDEFKLTANNAKVDCNAASSLSGFLGGLLVFASIYVLL
eukprot:CAMPEP_0119015644 /NCGR_PEP_ID=MMETSP1176-20130426/11350_1 /TAXON_ID=265551 /ORGANISM="Synedropsis recta cf, Strain CCMP1620" /LENGTH=155 /DNA_ID=CAMNT_0006968955 /DNA_START=51 /DNA_END=518 /DNA_ORIENTATION=+